MKVFIRQASLEDLSPILYLYSQVSKQESGIVRSYDEITEAFIADFLKKSSDNGLILLALTDNDELVGEMHAYNLGVKAFAHILGDLTIVVHPEFQGFGVGRQLFSSFLKKVTQEMPHICRIELFVRENNQKAVGFYEKMGFRKEGIFTKRIKNEDGSFENPIAMAWLR